MDLENAKDFAGYEPTAKDPGWGFTVSVVFFCALLNMSLPILVRIGQRRDKKRAAEAPLETRTEDSEHVDQESEARTLRTPSPPGRILLSPYQIALAAGAESVVSEAGSVKSVASSSIWSQAVSAVLEARPHRPGQTLIPGNRKRKNHKRTQQAAATKKSLVAHLQTKDDDDVSVGSKSVLSKLDQDAVSVRDAIDAAEGVVLLETDMEATSYWSQFLDIAEWDEESKRLVSLAIPYTIEGCTSGVFEIINLAIIGHFLGVMEANVYVVVSILVEFSSAITYGFGEAIGTLVPQAEGAGNNLLVGRYLQLSTLLYLVASIPGIFIWAYATESAVLWLGFDEETAALSQKFAYPCLAADFLSGVDSGLYEFLDVMGHEKYATILSMMSGAILSLALIVLVSLGAKDLVLLGLVEALLIFLVMIGNTAYVLHRGWLDKYWEGLAETLSLRDRRAVHTMMITAIPLSIAWLLTYGEWEVLTFFASYMGPAEVAAWGMLGYVWDTFEQITAGLSGAVEVRVGFRMGSGQPKTAKITAYKSMYMSAGIAVFSTAGLFIIAQYLPGWLTPDPTLQRMIFDTLPLMGFGQILLAVGSTAFGVVGAQGRVRLATAVEFFSSWIITLPLSAIFVYIGGYNLLGPVAALIFGYTVGGLIMGYIILTSDWKKLSEVVISRNAADGVTWEDNDWDELPPKVQAAAELLGYTKRLWDTDQEPPSVDRDWVELTSIERAAARTMGFNQHKWDNDSETGDDDSNEKNTSTYEGMDWDELPSQIREAAMVLGYNEDIWDNDREPSSTNKDWHKLSSKEQVAAKALGYREESWNDDSDDSSNEESSQDSNAEANKSSRNEQHLSQGVTLGIDDAIGSTVFHDGDKKGSSKAPKDSLQSLSVSSESAALKELPADVQAATITLGHSRDSSGVRTSPPEKAAARTMGFNQHKWDIESETRDEDSNEKNTSKYEGMDWDELPSQIREAAMVLGYNEDIWDDDREPPSTNKYWHKLSSKEQVAAKALGYREESWNDDSDDSSSEKSS